MALILFKLLKLNFPIKTSRLWMINYVVLPLPPSYDAAISLIFSQQKRKCKGVYFNQLKGCRWLVVGLAFRFSLCGASAGYSIAIVFFSVSMPISHQRGQGSTLNRLLGLQ